MEIYEYNSVGPSLTGFDLEKILEECRHRRHITYFLSEVKIEYEIACGEDKLELFYMGRKHVLPINQIEEMTKNKEKGFLIANGKLKPLEVRRKNKYIKIKGVQPKHSTTLEINGIHMHGILGTTPLKDALMKVKAINIKRSHYVLDTCTGLGYTAIHAARRGAKTVTVEIDEDVLFLAERNPWSWELKNKNILIVKGDIQEIVEEFPPNTFHRIIHDPPSILVSGELYSLTFYKKLYRVLKPGGLLFHYTGETGKHGRINILKGVARRLKDAGFYIEYYHRKAKGIIASKI